MENTQGSNKRPLLIAALIVALIGLGVFIVMGKAGKKGSAIPAPTGSQAVQKVPTPTLYPYPKGGSYSLKTADNLVRYPVDAQIKIILTASSGGANIVGYDAVLKYSLAGFAYTKTTSLLPDFQVFAKDNHGSIGASGVKTLTSSSGAVFENIPLLEFEFVAARKGTYTFSLRQKGSEANKLVDDKAQTTYPTTSKLQLEIY